jgi:hypothetical protein
VAPFPDPIKRRKVGSDENRTQDFRVKSQELGLNAELLEFLFFSTGHNSVGVSLRSSEDGNRSSCRNVVFLSYIEFSPMYTI